MFGIGQTEFVLIILFAFLLFGPDKLPQMGRTIGRALRQFRETQEKMTAVVQTEIVDPMTQTMQDPAAAAAKKKSPASDDDDLDADVESPAAQPARKETFAERRARLAAEKAAAEKGGTSEDAASEAPAAPVAQAPAATASAAEQTAAPADAPAADAGNKDAASAAEPASEEPKPMTTADLYARRPKKRASAPAADSDEQPAPQAAAAVTQGEGGAE